MPYAVPINRQSLDLIATNNGGLQPKIEMGPKGHPGTYFVLQDDPNQHAEIVPIEDFFETYEFLEPESLTEFRKVEVISRVPYKIDREELAKMAAAHTSGMKDALPEQADYEAADEMLEVLERLIAE
jgi:hypothetical protein